MAQGMAPSSRRVCHLEGAQWIEIRSLLRSLLRSGLEQQHMPKPVPKIGTKP